tara:strand:+ start:3867 stop:4151 length:285 start_codon:yes stop_codon:yes gene_type:complete
MKAKMHNYSDWVKETSSKKLKSYYNSVLIESGFKILNIIDKHFEPYGYTALFLLAESHFAIHTFPEQKTTYIELSSCVQKPYYKFLNIISNGQK